jgi:predicted DsbA family dithiol-disulfide isomerase
MDKRPAESQTTDNPPKAGPECAIVYYTDPLCCWSWAMESQWRRFQKEYGSRLSVSYRMMGLLPSWDRFSDALHSVSRPSQMGPEWMQAARISGLPIADKIWVTDPPSSSFPACIAVKCAGDQSTGLGVAYLLAAREAVMVEGRNIAKTQVLIDIAEEVSSDYPTFSLDKFERSLLGSRGRELFRLDYQQAHYLGINRSPTLVFKAGTKAILLRGYQSLDSLQQTMERMEL